MTPNAAFVWLDALEDLPPQTVIIFTTNAAGRIPARLRDRCERLAFESSALLLRPYLQELTDRIWREEGCAGSPPEVETLGVADENGNASFRRLVQKLTPYIRAGAAPAAPKPIAAEPEDRLHVFGRRWSGGERITAAGEGSRHVLESFVERADRSGLQQREPEHVYLVLCHGEEAAAGPGAGVHRSRLAARVHRQEGAAAGAQPGPCSRCRSRNTMRVSPRYWPSSIRPRFTRRSARTPCCCAGRSRGMPAIAASWPNGWKRPSASRSRSTGSTGSRVLPTRR